MTKKKDKQEEPQTHTEVWIYCHRWCSENGELWFKYLNGEQPMFYGRPLCSKKKGSPPVIGGLYEVQVEHNEDCTVRGKAKYQGMSSVEHDQWVEWSAVDEAQLAEHRKIKAAKKARKEDPMFLALEPIRNAYHKTNRAGQRAILAKVIAHITSYTKLK